MISVYICPICQTEYLMAANASGQDVKVSFTLATQLAAD